MMINCPECGNEVSNTAKTCTNCGYPVSKIGKNTTLSTWAALLAVITFTCPLGLILGLVDIGKKEPYRKHTGSWFAIIWFVFVVIIKFAL